MASESERSSSPLSRLAVPSLLAMFLAVYSYMTYQPPLETSRLQTLPAPGLPLPPTPEGVDVVWARMWEDPLESIPPASAPPPDATGLTPWRQFWNEGKAIDEVHKAISGNLKPPHSRLACLPVLLPGKPHADDSETRKRTAYAVLSALHAQGFGMGFGERMSYLRLSVGVTVGGGSKRQTNIAIPIKAFFRDPVRALGQAESRSSNDAPSAVLLLWINEDQLGERPLEALGSIAQRLFPSRWFANERILPEQVTLNILGPGSSDMLLRMVKEHQSGKTKALQKDFFPTFGEVKLYSYRATVDHGRPASTDESSQNFRVASLKLETAKAVQAFWDDPHVIRTIGSDSKLAEALRDELKLRNAWLDRAGNHVVLVTELDTLYGRALPVLFSDLAHKDTPTSDEKGADTESRQGKRLRVYRFLRGVDGQLPNQGQGKKDHEGQATGQTSSGPKPSAHSPAERPLGNHQLDYLRRLETELTEYDKRLRYDGERISAIGVVGTDVHDKLLVLKALRRHFPNTWFFTTDLDALYNEPSEYSVTRNLLVASHFALKLRHSLQEYAPPFRDSYQTSLFFTALVALKDRNLARVCDQGIDCHDWQKDPWGSRSENANSGDGMRLQPLMFEIGRTRPYQLTVFDPSDSRVSYFVHPYGPRHWQDDLARRLLILAVVAVLLFVWAERLWSPARRFLGWLASALGEGGMQRVLLVAATLATLALGTIIALDHVRPKGEPLALTEGISIWPSVVILWVASMTELTFLFAAVSHVRKSDEGKFAAYFDLPEEPGSALRRPGFLGELWTTFRREGAWATWGRYGVSRWKPRPEASSPLSDIAAQYGQKARWQVRLLRSLVTAALFAVVVALVFHCSGIPMQPYRGEWSQAAARLVTSTAHLCLYWLVFFVADAFQLSRRLVRQVADAEPAAQSVTTPAAQTMRMGVTFNHGLRELLVIRLIAEDTDAVRKLLYFPLLSIAMIFFARWPALDGWPITWTYLFVMLLVLSAVAVSAYSLRIEADHARTAVLRRLSDERLSALAEPGARERVEQIAAVIREIESEDRGAYLPLSKDWLFLAFSGGAGGVMIIEQLSHLLAN